jgi:hypothetical protein
LEDFGFVVLVRNLDETLGLIRRDIFVTDDNLRTNSGVFWA